MDEIKQQLTFLSGILSRNGETNYAERIDAALSASQEETKRFLISNELWGGAGSIADQALIGKPEKSGWS